MKLSAFVAATAVIGGSFLIPVPAEARNGWVHTHTSTNGINRWLKVTGRTGNFVQFILNQSNTETPIALLADCSKWRYKFTSKEFPGLNTEWEDVMPGSVFNSEFENILCR